MPIPPLGPGAPEIDALPNGIIFGVLIVVIVGVVVIAGVVVVVVWVIVFIDGACVVLPNDVKSYVGLVSRTVCNSDTGITFVFDSGVVISSRRVSDFCCARWISL